MSERLDDSDKITDEERYAETERAIAQAERDRQELWPMIKDFKVAQRSLLHRILQRNGRAEALSDDGESGLQALETLYGYGDMLEKLDELIRQEYLNGHHRLSSLSFKLFREEQAKTAENTPAEPESR